MCHNSISGALSEQRRTESLNKINCTFFLGKPVLTVAENRSVLINTDYIPTDGSHGFPLVAGGYNLKPPTSIVQAIPLSPVYQNPIGEYIIAPEQSPVNPIYESFDKSRHSSYAAPSPTTQIPSAPDTRSVWIMLPDEARAGSTIRIPLPNGEFTTVRIIITFPAYFRLNFALFCSFFFRF